MVVSSVTPSRGHQLFDRLLKSYRDPDANSTKGYPTRVVVEDLIDWIEYLEECRFGDEGFVTDEGEYIPKGKPMSTPPRRFCGHQGQVQRRRDRHPFKAIDWTDPSRTCRFCGGGFQHEPHRGYGADRVRNHRRSPNQRHQALQLARPTSTHLVDSYDPWFEEDYPDYFDWEDEDADGYQDWLEWDPDAPVAQTLSEYERWGSDLDLEDYEEEQEHDRWWLGLMSTSH